MRDSQFSVRSMAVGWKRKKGERIPLTACSTGAGERTVIKINQRVIDSPHERSAKLGPQIKMDGGAATAGRDASPLSAG